MKLRITIVTEVELGPESIVGTVEDYEEWKHDPEAVYDILCEHVYDQMASVENWRIEEAP